MKMKYLISSGKSSELNWYKMLKVVHITALKIHASIILWVKDLIKNKLIFPSRPIQKYTPETNFTQLFKIINRIINKI